MKNNKGSITVEACLVIPIFLFFFLAMNSFMMIFFATTHIHQSLAESANHVAVNAYLEQSILSEDEKEEVKTFVVNEVALMNQFLKYLGDDPYVGRVIKGGKKGILITIKKDLDNHKIFYAKATYIIHIPVPLLGTFTKVMKNEVKQKMFVGYTKDEEDFDTYVYITPNQSVYHNSRHCTHLSLNVTKKRGQPKDRKSICKFCKKAANDSKFYYTCKTTNICHFDRDCSGLKRTVNRVKKKSVSGLKACERCG